MRLLISRKHEGILSIIVAERRARGDRGGRRQHRRQRDAHNPAARRGAHRPAPRWKASSSSTPTGSPPGRTRATSVPRIRDARALMAQQWAMEEEHPALPRARRELWVEIEAATDAVDAAVERVLRREEPRPGPPRSWSTPTSGPASTACPRRCSTTSSSTPGTRRSSPPRSTRRARAGSGLAACAGRDEPVFAVDRRRSPSRACSAATRPWWTRGSPSSSASPAAWPTTSAARSRP